MLVQCLSNIVTGNDALRKEIWNLYMSQPEEQSLLM
jgi:hypothetical protein